MTVGVIMSTMEGVQYHGSTQIAKDFSPPVINMCIMISPHDTQDNPHGTHIPHGNEHPTVLKISSHIYHDINTGTEHPPRYSRYPPHAP